MMARRVVLTARPAGRIAEDHFGTVEVTVPEPGDGEVALRNLVFSLDPYLARRMRDWTLGEPEWRDGTIIGRTVGRIIASRAPGFAPGDLVLGFGPWQEHEVRPAASLHKLADADLPAGAHLGPLGASGLTAWAGIDLLDPQPGQTICITSAAGAVGSIAGQLAKLRGARAIGLAGGPDKCRTMVERYGFDAAVDHRAAGAADALGAAAPHGIDGHLESVGAAMLDLALPLLSKGARIALGGLIAHYQDEAPIALAHFRLLLDRAITMRGFHTADLGAREAIARSELAAHVRSGAIRYAETLHHGLDAVPAGFVAMLAGQGAGKHLVVLDEAPSALAVVAAAHS